MRTRKGLVTAGRSWMPRILLPVSALMLAGCEAPDKTASFGDEDQQAADTAFEVAADQPPNPRTLYSMARILAAQRRDAECEAVLKRIIREHPRFLLAYCDLAEMRMRQRRIDEAVGILNAARRQSPRDPVLVNNLGMCSMLKGEYEEALRGFTYAAGLAPDHTRYRANMAAALGMLARYEEAFSLYKQVMPVADAQHNIGILHQARGQLAGLSAVTPPEMTGPSRIQPVLSPQSPPQPPNLEEVFQEPFYLNVAYGNVGELRTED